ncbi:MAG: hypothetical protein JWO88_423, partial [Frankiales bacterium]|nr:hypothetical protein [Frankiales bacterium]
MTTALSLGAFSLTASPALAADITIDQCNNVGPG